MDDIDLDYYIDNPDEELPVDLVEEIGLDGTGRDGGERFPYTWGDLTADERETALYLTEEED